MFLTGNTLPAPIGTSAIFLSYNFGVINTKFFHEFKSIERIISMIVIALFPRGVMAYYDMVLFTYGNTR